MQKTTKIILAVGVILIALILGWFFLQQYAFNHPNVKVYFLSTGDGGENTYTVPQIEMTERSYMGISEEWDEKYFEAYKVIDEMISFASSYREYAPWHFDSEAENRDGGTVFIISGYYTENGEKKEIEKEFPVGFMLTDDIDREYVPENISAAHEHDHEN